MHNLNHQPFFLLFLLITRLVPFYYSNSFSQMSSSWSESSHLHDGFSGVGVGHHYLSIVQHDWRGLVSSAPQVWSCSRVSLMSGMMTWSEVARSALTARILTWSSETLNTVREGFKIKKKNRGIFYWGKVGELKNGIIH